MKLLKTESPYLDKSQWRKLFLALSIMTICLYIVAMIFSLCGSKYFILDYQNAQMDRIEAFLKDHGLMILLDYAFMTLEFVIVLAFVTNSKPYWWYIVLFYAPPMCVELVICDIPTWIYSIFPFLFYLTVPLINSKINHEHLTFKAYLLCILKLIIAVAVTYGLQFIIYEIKSGLFSTDNHIQALSVAFCFALEYDIALSIILYTIKLFMDKEKGDGKVCTNNTDSTHHNLGGFSQTSMKQSQKSKAKNLSKNQKTRLRLLYLRAYLTQTFGFLLLMVLPFLLGKVFEFLMMYLAFAIARYILGFNYSLHYKKESICITVGIIVFGILTLAVPFFTVDVILALVLGVSLAILLHLSYKYKGMWLFDKISRPDKFAQLYVLMDGDLTPHHVAIMCKHKGLDNEQTQIIMDFAEGNKKSYLAKKYCYSEKTIERKINEAIEIINENS